MHLPGAVEFNPNCRDCPRLARHLRHIRRELPEYHAYPVPPFGEVGARLLIVGLAPGMHGANRTGRPFTGDYAGILLYATLYEYGFTNRPQSLAQNDGLRLLNCRITNAVKCLPPANKPTAAEVNNCNRYLATELSLLKDKSVVLALGTIAHRAVIRALNLRQKDYVFGHARHYRLANRLHLLDSYHCSRYNSQTGRLTPAMFKAVVKKAKSLLVK
jgi:uracil-DNA glycosylase